MARFRWSLVFGTLICSVAAAAPASADPRARVAAAWGELRVERGGEFHVLAPGAAVLPADRLLTGSGDRAKIVFPDFGVVDLAPGSEAVLYRHPDPGATPPAVGRIEVVRGKVRARWVFHGADAPRYQVETQTAVVVAGGDYIVLYDEDRLETEVVALSEGVEVVGRLAIAGGAASLGVRDTTLVRRGQFPVSPERIDEVRYSQALHGFTIVGTGGADGLAAAHPAITGRLLSPRDLPEAVPAEEELGHGLVVDAPQEFLADEMSPDFRVHDQPILEYLRKQPGLDLPPTTGGVIVDF